MLPRLRTQRKVLGSAMITLKEYVRFTQPFVASRLFGRGLFTPASRLTVRRPRVVVMVTNRA